MKLKYFVLLVGIVMMVIGCYALLTNMKPLVKSHVSQSKAVSIAESKEETNKRANIDKKNWQKNNQSIYTEVPQQGDMFGTLQIPRINANLEIYEGTDEAELEKGIGHYAKSVLPGEKDNSVLSGHRDSVFRRLGEVKIGDELIVTTNAGTFTYKVKRIRIVDKDDRTVIVPKPTATLTVTTCYPFRYVGSAPERYILVAYLANSKLN